MKTAMAMTGVALTFAVVALRAYAVHHRTPEIPTPDQPHLIVSPAFNFGEVYANGSVTQSFILKNGGTAALTIKKLVPNCGCVVSASGPHVLKPGEEWSVPLTLSGGPNLGVFKRRLAIQSDDPVAPEQVIDLQANVVRDFAVTPPSIMLSSNEGLL